MVNQMRPSKAIHIILWAAQVLLAACFIWAGMMKLLQSPEKLAVMWPWAGQVPVALVKLTGVVDVLAAIGLVVPAMMRIKPGLTPLTAVGIIGLMLCAGVFHILRGEAATIGVNVVFAVLAAFIAWGRFKKARNE
jgi:uncharacterized membrane protein YphA (DoxX/SURF4 family)